MRRAFLITVLAATMSTIVAAPLHTNGAGADYKNSEAAVAGKKENPLMHAVAKASKRIWMIPTRCEPLLGSKAFPLLVRERDQLPTRCEARTLTERTGIGALVGRDKGVLFLRSEEFMYIFWNRVIPHFEKSLEPRRLVLGKAPGHSLPDFYTAALHVDIRCRQLLHAKLCVYSQV